MSAYSDRVIADGAVAYWRLGETAGTTAVDSIGGHNGTISGGVTLNQPGALSDGNRAMAFDGTGRIDTVWSLTVPTTYTVEAWVKLSVGGQRPIFANLNAPGTVYVGQAAFEMFLYAYGGTPEGVQTGNIGDNAWHHVVFVVT